MGRRDKKNLRSGFTTGASAAASVKGALHLLLTGKCPGSVWIGFIGGGGQEIPVHACERRGEGVWCSVIKDAGDDPDITNREEIGAFVTLAPGEGVDISGGKGVGRVTKPGLEMPPGEAAINPGPRNMIRTAVSEVFEKTGTSPCRVCAEIIVPRGEELARNTLNFRLGIVGGISILGTTGIVRPMSHEAYIATIRSSLSVANASGVSRVFFTTGRRSEKFAQALYPGDREEAFIQIGDFFEMSLKHASDMQFETITLVVFFGKAIKMAQGVPHTHAANSDLCLKKLAGWVSEMTGDESLVREIREANTARHAFTLLGGEHLDVIARVGQAMVQSAKGFMGKGRTRVQSVILDFEGDVVFDSMDPEFSGGRGEI